MAAWHNFKSGNTQVAKSWHFFKRQKMGSDSSAMLPGLCQQSRHFGGFGLADISVHLLDMNNWLSLEVSQLRKKAFCNKSFCLFNNVLGAG